MHTAHITYINYIIIAARTVEKQREKSIDSILLQKLN